MVGVSPVLIKYLGLLQTSSLNFSLSWPMIAFLRATYCCDLGEWNWFGLSWAGCWMREAMFTQWWSVTYMKICQMHDLSHTWWCNSDEVVTIFESGTGTTCDIYCLNGNEELAAWQTEWQNSDWKLIYSDSVISMANDLWQMWQSGNDGHIFLMAFSGLKCCQTVSCRDQIALNRQIILRLAYASGWMTYLLYHVTLHYEILVHDSDWVIAMLPKIKNKFSILFQFWCKILATSSNHTLQNERLENEWTNHPALIVISDLPRKHSTNIAESFH